MTRTAAAANPESELYGRLDAAGAKSPATGRHQPAGEAANTAGQR